MLGNNFCCLASLSTLLARSFQFSVAFVVDHLAQTSQAVRRCDVFDRAVQSNVVVMFDEPGNALRGFLFVCRATWTDALALERTVSSFQFAIALRIVGTGSHMRQPVLAYQFFEVLGDELGAIVADDPRSYPRMFFGGSGDYQLNF